MALLAPGSQYNYYIGNKRSFTGDGTTTIFTIANSSNAFPNATANDINVYFDGVLQLSTAAPTFTFQHSVTDGWHVLFTVAPVNGVVVEIEFADNNFGNYQFTPLENIINQFMFAYVGEDKIISKTKRLDVAYHAQRAMQELSFDTFKSCKAQEI